MTDTETRLRAVFLSGLVVLSVLALATAGIGAVEPADENQDVAAVSDVQSDELRAGIGGGLGSANGTTPGSQPAQEGERRALVFLDPADVDPEMSPEQVKARLRAAADRIQPRVSAQLERRGVEVENGFWIVNALVVTYDPAEMATSEMAAIDGVRLVTRSPDVEPPTPIQAESARPAGANHTWGLEQINVPAFWDEYDTKGEGGTIVIQDNGFDTEHEALNFEEAWRINSSGMRDGPPSVGNHGTHVAGTAAGTEDPNGLAFGIAPEAELHGHDIFTADDVVAASIGSMQIAAEIDADVVSGSWGSGCNPFFPEPVYNDDQINPVNNTRLAGTAVVSSAGNAGESCVSGFANDYETFSVGASNENGKITDFSSGSLIDKDSGQPDWETGTWNNPPEWWPQSWIAPRVAAPGENVYSSVPGDDYDGTYSGTSMAAPHVAGSIALLQAATDQDVPGRELRDALVETASKPSDWDADNARWTNDDSTMDQPGIDSRYGHGIIDVLAAADRVTTAAIPDIVADANGDGEITVRDSAIIKQHLVGMLPDAFDENLADADRNGEVKVRDSVLIKQYLVGMIENGTLDVSNLRITETSDSTVTDRTENVSRTVADTDSAIEDGKFVVVDLANVGGMGVVQDVELRIADDRSGLDDPSATVATPRTDLGPGEEVVTMFVVPADELSKGDWVGVYSEDDEVETQY